MTDEQILAAIKANAHTAAATGRFAVDAITLLLACTNTDADKFAALIRDLQYGDHENNAGSSTYNTLRAALLRSLDEITRQRRQ